MFVGAQLVTVGQWIPWLRNSGLNIPMKIGRRLCTLLETRSCSLASSKYVRDCSRPVQFFGGKGDRYEPGGSKMNKSKSERITVRRTVSTGNAGKV